MPLFGKNSRGKWYPITFPENEEFTLSDVCRDPDYNEMPKSLIVAVDCPEQPPAAEPVVINRPDIDPTSAGAISGPEGLVERPVVATELPAEKASEKVPDPEPSKTADPTGITDDTSTTASENSTETPVSPSTDTSESSADPETPAVVPAAGE